MAHPANATDLSPDAQLLHLEGGPARDQGRLGKLGQTGTHRQRSGSGVIAKRGCCSGYARVMRANASPARAERAPRDHELSIERTFDAEARLVEHVRVNHRRAHVFVAE